MTDPVREAVAILRDAIDKCIVGWTPGVGFSVNPRSFLSHAIRHIAYPDRDFYPKMRGQRKTTRRRRI